MKKVYLKNSDINKLSKYLDKSDINKFILLLGKFAKIYGMTKLANECGRNRESLYKVFTENSRPKFQTIHDILNCFGLNLQISSTDIKK
jgi:probable addiction module antidote protein